VRRVVPVPDQEHGARHGGQQHDATGPCQPCRESAGCWPDEGIAADGTELGTVVGVLTLLLAGPAVAAEVGSVGPFPGR
jgi:hypothetical protein